MAALPRQAGRQGQLSLALQLCTTAMMLVLLVQSNVLWGSSTTTNAASGGGTAGATSAPATSSACSWTPFMLPFEAQQWAIDATRQEMPTLVQPHRRHLTVQLAAGALLQGIEGDFVETGTWSGGTTILMLQALEKYDTTKARQHWACDSFKGLPAPVHQDLGGTLASGSEGSMAIGREVFERSVASFNLTTHERMHILEGWFNETLPAAPISRISFLRLDGDMYASTMDALEALYDKVSPGGLIYVDDYGSFTGCRRAIDEFRQQRKVASPLYLQGLPDQTFGEPGAKAMWEAAWWVKC